MDSKSETIFEKFENEVTHGTVLHKQKQNCFLKSHQITFYTANSYNSTNLVQYKGQYHIFLNLNISKTLILFGFCTVTYP